MRGTLLLPMVKLTVPALTVTVVGMESPVILIFPLKDGGVDAQAVERGMKGVLPEPSVMADPLMAWISPEVEPLTVFHRRC